MKKRLNGIWFALAVVALLPLCAVRAADTWWVDCDNGDDSYTGDDIGSEAHPFATIQAGVDKAQSGDTVKVKPGDYDTKETADQRGSSNRVYITKCIYLKSTDGAAKTRIVGKWSGEDPDGEAKKDGDAVRCIGVRTATSGGNRYGAKTVIEGFTLADGSAFNGPATGASGDRLGGGAIAADNQNTDVCVVDCVITNCTGGGSAGKTGSSSAGFAVNVSLFRSRIVDCSGWFGVYQTRCFACAFSGCKTYRAPIAYSMAANCSIADCTGGCILFNNSTTRGALFNCLATEADCSKKVANSTPYPNDGNLFTTAGGVCVDVAGGDFRLLPDSSAIGVANSTNVDLVVSFVSAIVAIERKDMSGTAIPETACVINAGAVQTVRTKLTIAEFPYGGATVSGAEVGETWIDEPLTVTVSKADGGTRNCIGAIVGGARHLFADEPGGIIFTVNPGDAALAVEPLYSTDWYVDASRPDDSGDGFTPQTAKRTLADACTNTLTLAGDTIHVAPGVYDTGVCAPSEGHVIGARAAVPAGVTLLADGSVDETIIEGAEATEPNRDLADAFAVYHTGTDAVRCVFLNDNSAVRGFTLRNGVTRGLNTATGAGSSNPDFCGGGVSGPHAAGAGWHLHVVENCVISNCVAAWGGAADGVRLVGCRLIDNFATRYGRHSNYCSEEGSCFSGLSGLSGATVAYITFYPQRMLNSTYCANSTDGAFDNDVAIPPTNCVFLGKLAKSDIACRSEHCIFIRYATEVVKPENILTDTCLFLDNAAAFGLDADFRPASTNSPVVDFCATIPDRLSALDPAGVQRVYNGRIDCGAYEYDWRGEYAKALLPRGKCLSVAVADGCVREIDGKVCLPAGKLVLRFTSDKADPDDLLATVSVRVPDGGTLAVTAGGAALEPVADEELGVWNYAVNRLDSEFDVTFEYSGTGRAEFLGVAKAKTGLLLLFR